LIVYIKALSSSHICCLCCLFVPRGSRLVPEPREDGAQHLTASLPAVVSHDVAVLLGLGHGIAKHESGLGEGEGR